MGIKLLTVTHSYADGSCRVHHAWSYEEITEEQAEEAFSLQREEGDDVEITLESQSDIPDIATLIDD